MDRRPRGEEEAGRCLFVTKSNTCGRRRTEGGSTAGDKAEDEILGGRFADKLEKCCGASGSVHVGDRMPSFQQLTMFEWYTVAVFGYDHSFAYAVAFSRNCLHSIIVN